MTIGIDSQNRLHAPEVFARPQFVGSHVMPSRRRCHAGLACRASASCDAKVPPRNLAFLIYISGAMVSANKLPLLKRALLLHVDQLCLAGLAGLVRLVRLVAHMLSTRFG